MYVVSASGVALGILLWVQVEVQLLKDVGTLLGVPVLSPMVGVDDNIWVIGVDPSTVGGREREREMSVYVCTAGNCTQC